MKRTNSIQWGLMGLVILFCARLNAQNELYIAPNGNDSNNGTINQPLATLIGARNKARSTGARTIWIRGGRYNYDATCDLGGQDAGMTFSGYRDEKVIFDGSKFVNAQKFQKVTENALLNKLHNKAKGNVYSQVITDRGIVDLLLKSTAQISVNDQMMTVSRFPNIGFAHVNNNMINGGEQVNTKGTNGAPKGPRFKIVENIDGSKWNAELNRTKKPSISGYVSADWLKETIPLNSVSTSGEFRLTDGTRYGLKKRGASPNRFFVFNILAELDEPGEWYFDNKDARLYLWPTTPINKDMTVGVWAGPQLFEIKDTRDITVKKFTVQNVGKGNNGQGAINITGSSDKILVAGVTFRFIAAPITSVNIWHDVTNSGVKSCDFYDVSNNSRLYGGKITSTSVTYGRNYMENCHFTQIYSKDFYGKACGITGAGNIFRNNLIHNMNGQPITHAGVDHLIERNEAFNVGIEEGDGGAFYTGANVWSFGNVIRHNFVHHLMRVPKLLGRAAFFSDDYDAGETVMENIVYKGGWQAIKMNKGGGHTIKQNVVIETWVGISNGDGGVKPYNTCLDYLKTNPTANNKDNYIGRMLKEIGKSGWQNGLNENNWKDRIEPFWTNRYPFLKNLTNKYSSNKAMNAYECRYYDNIFSGNNTNIKGGPSVAIQNSKTVGLNLFVNPSVLNFGFKNPRPSYAPNIPFNNIGLYKDEFRCAVPNKDVYRGKVKQRFNGKISHTSANYDTKTINSLLYYNTGEMVYATIPCAMEGSPTTSPPVAERTEFLFDVGTESSPVFNGYTRVSNKTTGGDFGWANTSGLDTRDRGAGPGTNNINRDFVFSREVRTFETKVSNGAWNVLLTFGDRNYSHDNIQVKAEGQTKLTNVNTTKGVFFNRSFDINVSDGRLSIEFSDQGGAAGPYWQVTRIWLRKKGTNGAKLLTEINSDLISVYPNPTEQVLNLDLGSLGVSNASVKIFDGLGKVIKTQQLSEVSTAINVSALNSGMYFMLIENANESYSETFVKK